MTPYSFLLSIVFLTASTAFGQVDPPWTFHELTQRSDVVVIARVGPSVLHEQTEYHPKYLQGVTTELRISAVLKGDIKSVTLNFEHFCYRKSVGSIGNGPKLIVFKAKEEDSKAVGFVEENDKGEYIYVTDASVFFVFFLVALEDGSYAPTSGRRRAPFSIAELKGQNARRYEDLTDK